MEIYIQKNASVSLHNQLVTQISMQIASGLLRPGAKLPSIRALSSKLGIHHNTVFAAYKELEDVGLIEIRHGSGARVKLLDEDSRDAAVSQAELSDLETLARFFVGQVLRKRYEWRDVIDALEKARRAMGEQTLHPIVFVDLHPDILPVFRSELETALERPVRAINLTDLDPAAEPESHFIVSRYHCQSLRNKLKSGGIQHPDERITMIEVGSGQQELALIKQLPDGALVVVVSSSTIILRQAEAVVQALRGESLILRAVLADEEPADEVQRLIKRASAIFADALCAPNLATLSRKPIHTIKVLPERELEKLQAFRRGNRNGSLISDSD